MQTHDIFRAGSTESGERPRVHELYTGHQVFEAGPDGNDGKLLSVRFRDGDSELISVWPDGTIGKHFLGVRPAANERALKILDLRARHARWLLSMMSQVFFIPASRLPQIGE